MTLWDDVAKEDFRDETMSMIVGIVGLTAAKRIVEMLGGDSVYVPKAESVIRMARDRRIYNEFKANGFHYRELADKYNLTPRHVRAIIKTQRKIQNKIKEKQLEMF